MQFMTRSAIQINSFLLFILSLFITGIYTLPLSAQPSGVTITSIPHTIPILVGMPENPILQVVVANQTGNNLPVTQLKCHLNEDALPFIWHIQVYMTAAEPFSTNQLLATYHPTTPDFTLSVTADCPPGVHFIWFSIALKVDADIDGRVELHCDEIIDSKGNKYPVTVQSGDYSRRKGAVVRHAGEDGVHTYRIPGLICTDKGTLIAVYDARYKNSSDLPGDIDVGMSRSLDRGNTWQDLRIIMDMGPPHDNNGVGDPAILFDPLTKKIVVAALWSKGNRSIVGSMPGLSPDTTGQIVISSSTDDGISWTKPRTITPQVKKPTWRLFFQGPGSGIAMQDGSLVFPAQYWDENKIPYSTLIYSDDHGKNWKGNISGPKSNTTESSVVETAPGTLMLNMRDNRGGFRSVATTKDMGRTWLEHSTSYHTLPDPVCMGSLIKAKVKINGELKEVLFFSNPNTISGRYDITIKASLDMGETWKDANQLLIDERPCFGYSSLTQIDENTIGILYEGNRDLYFVRIPVSTIIHDQ
jgi:sialidase-1